MSAKGVCVAIGLNRVDTRAPAYTDVTMPVLAGCINDAESIAGLCESLGYQPATVLIDGQATRKAVLDALTAAATILEYGDTLVFSYSGHGMLGSFAEGADPNDATCTSWILYDQPLADFELAARWPMFKRGVRIIVLSDSCHSGSATRQISPSRQRNKGLHTSQREQVLKNCAAKFKRRPKKLRDLAPGAGIVLISSCTDSETSLDSTDESGKPHGLFTAALLKVWAFGKWTGDLMHFVEAVRVETSARSQATDPGHSQTPQFFPTGDVLVCIQIARSKPPFQP